MAWSKWGDVVADLEEQERSPSQGREAPSQKTERDGERLLPDLEEEAALLLDVSPVKPVF